MIDLEIIEHRCSAWFEVEPNRCGVDVLADYAVSDIRALIDEIKRLRKLLDESEADTHLRIRSSYDKTIANAWRVKVAELEQDVTFWRDEHNSACETMQAGIERMANALGMDSDSDRDWSAIVMEAADLQRRNAVLLEELDVVRDDEDRAWYEVDRLKKINQDLMSRGDTCDAA